MIVNIPTPESLDDVALRLYFTAWSSIMRIRSDFDQTFPPGDDPRPEKGAWKNEWTEYVAGYQPELQAVCSIIQQSNELTLKSKICSISPYLLLLNSDPKFSTVPRDVEFAEFRTLDAVDLPAAVNSLSAKPLSDEFIQNYNQIRSVRNKIAHLGHAGHDFNLEELLGLLIRQYIELWSDRAWLKDRITFASRTGRAFFHDGKHSSAESEVMYELPLIFAAIKKSAFKKLFGIDKSTRRYLCHACLSEARTSFSEYDLDECKTAYLKEESSMHCLMCGEDYEVKRQPCCVEGCKGNVISESEYVGCDVCNTCGNEQHDESGN